jgi:hypothetical protein
MLRIQRRDSQFFDPMNPKSGVFWPMLRIQSRDSLLFDPLNPGSGMEKPDPD